jgi:hypothetical protein
MRHRLTKFATAAVAMVILLCAVPMCAVQITGTIQIPTGIRFNGTLTLTPLKGGQDTCASRVLVPTSTTFDVVNGQLPSTASVISADCIQPSNVPYVAEFRDLYGRLVFQANYLINGSSAYDLGTATPTSITTLNVSYVNIPSTTKSNLWTAAQIGAFNGVYYCTTVVADGVTDDSGHINSCVASAIAGKYGAIKFPSGQIKVNTPLNFTNLASLKIMGASPGFGGFGDLISQATMTELLCNTGAVCWDNTGSSWLDIRDIELRTTNLFSNPSTVGMLFGRDNAAGGGTGQYCYSQFNTLTNVVVYFEPLASATAKGRIGLYNIGAEHFTIHGGLFRGDVGAFFGLTNPLAVASAYQTLQTSCPASMTVVDVDSATSFQAAGLTSNQSAIEFFGAQLANFNFRSFHAINSNGNGAQAINFNNGGGTAYNMYMQGQLEGFPRAYNFNGNLDSSTLATTSVSPTSSLIGVGVGISITNSKIALTQLNGTPQAVFSAGSGNTFKGDEIHAGPFAGLSGIASSNITLLQSKVYMPGTSANISVAAGSKYELIDDAGDQYIGGVGADLYKITGVLWETSAPPSIASGFGTSPSITSNGSASFLLTIGTGGTANTGTLTMPAASHGWVCNPTDITNTTTNVFVTKQTGYSTTSVTFTQFNNAAVITAWAANDQLLVNCMAF